MTDQQLSKVVVEAFEAIPITKESDLVFPALTCQLSAAKLTCLVGPYR
jgi:hypothetical protein